MEVSKDLIPYCPKCGSPMVIRMGKRSFILKDGELTNKAFLSSGTKSGIAVADILYSIKEEGQGLYFCDEKFSYINSVSTWYLYGSRGEARKRIDSRVGRLKSGIGWL